MTGVESDTRRESFEREGLVHMDDLHGLALRLTGGDEARSEDLVQTTYLRAWRRWDRYEAGTNCRAWLMTILRNTFINEYHARGRRPTSVDYDDVKERSVFEGLGVDDPEARFFENLVDDRITRAIEDLPEEFRLPLVLSDLEGLSYPEIAETLELPLGTVKSRLFRARRRLQGELYDYAKEAGIIS